MTGSTLTCCLWWFLFGILIGWLLSWLLGRWLGRNSAHISEPRNYDTPRASTVASIPGRIDLNAARAAGLTIKSEDDLEVVEGIGPKIAELLRNNGVVTFAGLAAMSVPSLQSILDKGGANFKLSNPETWAEQAALAVQNRWTELKALQDHLRVGVRPKN